MALLIFYVSLALGVSFLCSIMEAVLLSVSPSYVAGQVEEGGAYGLALAKMKKDVDRPLAAILSLNTIAHTVGAAGAGAQAAAVFGNAYLGAASAVLTFLILVVSEIIPKTLGALYWRGLAPAVIRVLRPTIWLMWPLVKLAEGLTWLMSRGKAEGSIRRDEFPALADVGVKEGVLHKDESRIMRSLLRFGELTVADVMTPRTVVFALEQDLTVDSVLRDHPVMSFSRIPIFDGNIDTITGHVLRYDMLHSAVEGEREASLSALKRPILSIRSNVSLREFLDLLMRERAHMAIVVGEYGGTQGVVTLEDALETLIGHEIVDEADTVEDMRQLARQQWKERREAMGLEIPEKGSAGQSQ
ncbi:MAG: HlyC/CorC family transporter [Rhodothermales bacterium]|nr:HlyC/CorC family transporter [Rhodothermales bacterium]